MRLAFAIALGCIASATLGLHVLTPEAADGVSVVRALEHWDSSWYANIATNGYTYAGPTQQSPVAFFPGYPVSLRPLIALGADPFVAGEAMTLIYGLGALALLFRWERTVRAKRGLPEGSTGTLTLMLYPCAFYLYGVMYGDALYLLLAVAAFLALEEGKPGWATLFGAVATSCRPIAPALVAGLLVRSLELRLTAKEKVRPIDLLPVFAAGGFGAYMLFLWIQFGDPVAFASVQAAPGWDQVPGPATWFKYEWFRVMFPRVAPSVALRLGGQALLTVGALALVVPTWKRLGRGYGVYGLVAMGLAALGTKDFHGLGRYALAAFPLFLTFGLLLDERPRLKRAWLAASAVALFALAFAFGGGASIS